MLWLIATLVFLLLRLHRVIPWMQCWEAEPRGGQGCAESTAWP